MLHSLFGKVDAVFDFIVCQFCPRLFLNGWLSVDGSADPDATDALIGGELIFYPALGMFAEECLEILVDRHVSVLVLDDKIP